MPGKGSHFERVVAKAVGRLLKPYGIQQSECWRSILSGGHKASHGDLDLSAAALALFPYTVECKFWKSFRPEHLWENFGPKKGPGQIQKWMDQAINETKDGTETLVVAKTNHFPALAIVTESPVFAACCVPQYWPRFVFRYRGKPWQVLLFQDFMELWKKRLEEGKGRGRMK